MNPSEFTAIFRFSLQLPLKIFLRYFFSYFFQHYKKSIIDSFDQHPDANFLLLLEEDLDVSVDILSYFKQLLPVYENDESVYCISAWNDQVKIKQVRPDLISPHTQSSFFSRLVSFITQGTSETGPDNSIVMTYLNFTYALKSMNRSKVRRMCHYLLKL